MILLAVGTLIFCSCRAPQALVVPADVTEPTAVAETAPAIDSASVSDTSKVTTAAHAAVCHDCLPIRPTVAPYGSGALPLPISSTGSWRPPGIACPWPENEYLCDGGDYGWPATAYANQTIAGLDPEDAVARYETEDGERVIKPSNRVCIYAPRFGAIRRVTAVAANEQILAPRGVDNPEGPGRTEVVDRPVGSLQNVRPNLNVGTKLVRHYRMQEGDGLLSSVLRPEEFVSAFAAFEDIAVIRYGVIEVDDGPLLITGVDAAITWTTDQAVQVVLEGRTAAAVTGDRRAQAIFTVEEAPCDKLRLIKVASQQVAEPGEFVDFTLRFDNMGNRPLYRVAIVDHLTIRLAYVPDSAQASVAAKFSVEEKVGDTLVLRWDLEEPLEPGEGGIARFRCRVR